MNTNQSLALKQYVPIYLSTHLGVVVTEESKQNLYYQSKEGELKCISEYFMIYQGDHKQKYVYVSKYEMYIKLKTNNPLEFARKYSIGITDYAAFVALFEELWHNNSWTIDFRLVSHKQYQMYMTLHKPVKSNPHESSSCAF